MGTYRSRSFFIISGYFLFPVQTTSSGEFSPKTLILSKLKKLWIPYILSIGLIWIFLRTGINPNYMPSIKELLINPTGLAPIFNVRYIDGAHWYMIQLGVFIILGIIVRSMRFKLVYVIPGYFIMCMSTYYFFNELIKQSNLLLLICGQYYNNWNFITLLLGICLKQFFNTSTKHVKSIFFHTSSSYVLAYIYSISLRIGIPLQLQQALSAFSLFSVSA